MQDGPITTFLFTDIEGSTRLWEEEPEHMRAALARHDAIARAAVESNGGQVVKMTGDGLHAAFGDPAGAIASALELQQGIEAFARDGGLTLRVRCGLHAGVHHARDNDFYGSDVNRAARIMAAAHGGQVLASQAVAALVAARMPPDATLKDLGRVRLRDLSIPEQVYQLVHPALRSEFPPLRSLEAVPNNLPQALTSFVGRERDVAGVRSLLERSRLTTVTGMGGLGKTRLALQVAAEIQDRFPDGVWLVELGDIADARLVSQAIAGTLRVKDDATRPALEALASHLANRKLLVILDNCEHVLDECAALAKRMLAAGPGVRMLATSREPLRLAGESVYVLPALELPNLRAPFEPAVLLRNEAARLFVERAQAASSGFALTAHNAADLAAICHRLDGIPLALELAAARVRTLPLDALAERLKDRFRLLRTGDRTASPRQHTLRALIDWSYELLTDAERALLQQLSVFAGGWTVESAEAVCRCGDDDVLDLVGNLVEKSLAVHDAAAGRYRLLETVRQYAQERLAESGSGEEARARHLQYFEELGARAEGEIIGDDAARWLAVLDSERENVIAALSGERGRRQDKLTRLRLAVHMKRYWLHRGLLQLGLQLTVDVLDASAEVEPAARNAALFAAGQLEYLVGDYAEARRYLEESLALMRAMGDESSLPAVLQSLGMAAQGQGDLVAARGHLEEALRCAKAGGNPRRIAAAMNALAQLELEASHVDAAEPLLEGVAAISRSIGDRETLAIVLLNLAMTRTVRRSYGMARDLLRETALIAQQLGSRRIDQCLLDISAGLAAEIGQSLHSARFHGAADALARSTGLKREAPDEAFLAPLMERVRRELGPERFAREVAAASALDHDSVAVELRGWLFRDPE